MIVDHHRIVECVGAASTFYNSIIICLKTLGQLGNSENGNHGGFSRHVHMENRLQHRKCRYEQPVQIMAVWASSHERASRCTLCGLSKLTLMSQGLTISLKFTAIKI